MYDLYCVFDETTLAGHPPATGPSRTIHFLVQNATHSAAAHVHLPLAQMRITRIGWIWMDLGHVNQKENTTQRQLGTLKTAGRCPVRSLLRMQHRLRVQSLCDSTCDKKRVCAGNTLLDHIVPFP